jgi:hypothetical protein
MGAELEVLAAPFREPSGPLRWKIHQLQGAARPLVTIVVPTLILRWWQRPLYRQMTRAVVAAPDSPGTAVVVLPLDLSPVLRDDGRGASAQAGGDAKTDRVPAHHP